MQCTREPNQALITLSRSQRDESEHDIHNYSDRRLRPEHHRRIGDSCHPGGLGKVEALIASRSTESRCVGVGRSLRSLQKHRLAAVLFLFLAGIGTASLCTRKQPGGGVAPGDKEPADVGAELGPSSEPITVAWTLRTSQVGRGAVVNHLVMSGSKTASHSQYEPG